MQNYARLGIFGILALIALRVTIGWHFYMEGVAKVRGHDFSSVGFLNAAQGPLAPEFQKLIWDHDGELRLDQAEITQLFSAAADRSAAHFGLTDEQNKALGRIKSQTIDKLGEIYDESKDAIDKYNLSRERLANMDSSKMWNEVSSLRGQKEQIERERMSDVRKALASIDAVWTQYEGRLNSVANATQLQSAGRFHFGRPGEGLLSTRVVDKIIPIFVMAVGVLLIIGLLTPLAAWAAALFLVSIILSQMPGFPGTQPTYYQSIESLALITLATTGAGRYAGLDFFPWAWRQNKKAARLRAAKASA